MKKTSLNTLTAFTAMSVLAATSAQADLVLNGEFDSAWTAFENNLTTVEMNQGWSAKNTGWDHEGTNLNAVSVAANSFGIAQLNAIGSESGSSITISFDWTPDALATTAGDLTLTYSLAGWTTTSGDTTGMLATDKWFNAIDTPQIRTDGAAVGFTGYDLLGDASTTENISAGQTSVLGVAGVTTEYSLVIDISGNTSSVTDISQLDWFSVSFAQASGAVGGGTLDNVSIVVPEPSSYALLAGLVGLSYVMVRRRS